MEISLVVLFRIVSSILHAIPWIPNKILWLIEGKELAYSEHSGSHISYVLRSLSNRKSSEQRFRTR